MICPRCKSSFPDTMRYCPNDGAHLVESLRLDEAKAPPPPRGVLVAGRFRLTSLLGQGAMARVFEATDETTGATVAIKVLSREYAENFRERARFLREAYAARQISHPNVVQVLDSGTLDDERPFLAVELLRGETLGEYIRHAGPMPWRHALEVIRDASAGLGAAHNVGIIHRDLKPDNIFIAKTHAGEVTKIVDFGLAKLHSHPSSYVGQAIGTAAYMPPEQVLSDPIDARADVYALGVVLFRAITGHLPFDGSKDLDTLSQQLFIEPPPVSWLADDIPEAVDILIARAMRKHPDNRHRNAMAFGEDLTRALDGHSIEETPLVRVPDLYRPATKLSRDVAMLLSRHLGHMPDGWLR